MESNGRRWPVTTTALLVTLAIVAAGCSAGTGDHGAGAAPPPSWTYDSTLVFPGNGSLTRPEDGIALQDGRLIVSDQVHGLRLVEIDGTSKPFGNLAAAGYSHRPPGHPGGANGISLEPNGTHLLVADVFGGAIYRVDVSSGATDKVYQHLYGINTAVRDSSGAIWFTQSAHNTPEAGEARLWEAVDIQRAEGALLRLGTEKGRLAAEAEVVVDSLSFANGLAIDEADGRLYVAETTGGRVLRYRVDLAAGKVSERSVFADGVVAGQPGTGRRGPLVGRVATRQRSAGGEYDDRRPAQCLSLVDSRPAGGHRGVLSARPGRCVPHGTVHAGHVGPTAGADHRNHSWVTRRTGLLHRIGECLAEAPTLRTTPAQFAIPIRNPQSAICNPQSAIRFPPCPDSPVAPSCLPRPPASPRPPRFVRRRPRPASRAPTAAFAWPSSAPAARASPTCAITWR